MLWPNRIPTSSTPVWESRASGVTSATATEYISPLTAERLGHIWAWKKPATSPAFASTQRTRTWSTWPPWETPSGPTARGVCSAPRTEARVGSRSSPRARGPGPLIYPWTNAILETCTSHSGKLSAPLGASAAAVLAAAFSSPPTPVTPGRS